MDQLRRVIESVRSAYESLRPTHKLLALSLATVLGMTLFLVSEYSSRSSMVPLMSASYSADEQAQAEQYLKEKGIDYENGPDGSIMVPAGQQIRIMGGLAEEGRLPGDTSLMFRNLIDRYSWTMTSSDKDRAYQLTLQNELARALTAWSSITKATVILNLPDTRTLGRPSEKPTASVSVVPAGSFSQKNADAIAAFVAGASRGLVIEDVRVTDTSGRQYKAATDDQITATTTQELQAHVERRHQNKIYELLSPQIPGVIVAVTAQVDATRTQTTRDIGLAEGDGTVSVLTEQNRTSNENSGSTNGGGAGVRANVQADISTGGAVGSSSSESDSTAKFQSKIGTEVKQIVDPRGFAKKVSAVVNVPRAYFAEIWRMEQQRLAAADDTVEPPVEGIDPTDTQISAIRDAELTRIEEEVAKLIDMSSNDGAVAGDVSVSMMQLTPTTLMTTGEQQSAGFLGLGGGSASGGGVNGAIKTLGLGGLAVLALGLMVFTALKANKTEDLPSAEELVGIPKALESDNEIIGEADGTDPPLEGIELSDDEMHHRRMESQVGEVVRERPEDVAGIITQWMGEDE